MDWKKQVRSFEALMRLAPISIVLQNRFTPNTHTQTQTDRHSRPSLPLYSFSPLPFYLFHHLTLFPPASHALKTVDLPSLFRESRKSESKNENESVKHFAKTRNRRERERERKKKKLRREVKEA